jgi:hypothetical protein
MTAYFASNKIWHKCFGAEWMEEGGSLEVVEFFADPF